MVDHGLPMNPPQSQDPSTFTQKSDLNRYLNPESLVIKDPQNPDVLSLTPFNDHEIFLNKDEVLDANLYYDESPPKFVPNDEQKKSIMKMHTIVQNHILMNYMIKWIENGFMEYNNITPDRVKDKSCDLSSIDKPEDVHYLQPITEESIEDINNENMSSENRK